MKLSTILTSLALTLVIFNHQSFSQCPTQTVLGVNLVCNGDFESGDSCFSTDYNQHSSAPDVGCGTCFRDWSNPDEYQVTTNVQTQFHTGFPNIADHTPGSGNHMLSVDGSCTPGLMVWCQNVTVQANSNYYFTSWVTSLHASNPAQLRYRINGISVGATINAPATVGTWTSYTYTWFSGATTGNISICIENLTTAGCGNGNDFALDDISFQEGCVFGTAGPQPDLGPDRSLCGTGGSITLDANVPINATTTVTWNDGTSGTGLSAPYTKTVSAPGTYSVCVQDAGSCIKSDIIVITSGFSINLGPDVVLCNPTSAVLDAGYTNGTTTYVWYKDGVVIPGATSRTYTATSPGTYRVEATDASCSVMAFDEIVISSQAALPNDNTFCPVSSGGTGTSNLSVTGSGGYKWYANETDINPIATGNSYTATGLTGSGPYVYWVEDTSTFAYTVGPSNGTNNVSPFSSGFGEGSTTNRYLEFDVSVPITLVAVTVYGKIYNPNESITVSITLRNSAGTQQWQITRTVTGPPYVPPGNDWRFVIPVGQNLPVGTNWRISNEGPSTGQIFWAQGGGNSVAWPYTVPGVISLKGIGPTASWSWCTSTCYGFFYNWEIQAGVPCGRVPVTATQDCPACMGSVAATSANVTPSSFCAGATSQITLSVGNTGSGDELVWYSGSCGGTEVGRNSTGNDITITAPSATTTYYARWESVGCNSACVSATATILPDISTPDAGPDISTCINSVNLNAITPTIGTGTWSSGSGGITFNDVNNPNTQVSGLSNGNNTLTWTVTGCGGPLSDDVIVNFSGLNSINMDLIGPSDTLCVNTTRELNALVTGGSGNFTFTWTSSDNSFSNSSSEPIVTVSPIGTSTTYYVYASDNVNVGCSSNIDSTIVHAISNQDLWFSNLLTPNNDGLNDKFIARDKLTQHPPLSGSTLEIYNRWGQRVFSSINYDNNWGGANLSDGMYFYYLKSGCGETTYRGWLQIIGNTDN